MSTAAVAETISAREIAPVSIEMSKALVPLPSTVAADLAVQFRAKIIALEAMDASRKQQVMELGELAVRMYEVVPHGQWASYCKRELGKSDSSILDYRKVYLGRQLVKPESVSIREMLEDIREAQLVTRNLPPTRPAKNKVRSKSRARPDFDGPGIARGTTAARGSRLDHVHYLALGSGMAPYGVINTRNSSAWLLRAAAWRDRVSKKRSHPLARKGDDEPLEPGSNAALTELLLRWYCPEGGRVLDTKPVRERRLAVEDLGRKYIPLDGETDFADLDLLLVHLDRGAEDVDFESLLGALKDGRFACVIASDAREITRAMISFMYLGASLASEAVLLLPTPARNVTPFIETRTIHPAHQHLLVFVKGEIASAVAACPPLDDDDLQEFAHLRPSCLYACKKGYKDKSDDDTQVDAYA